MSRALGKDTAASIATGDAVAAYKAIADTLRLSPADGLLEIEILPKSHQLDPGTYLLRDGPAVAVSKLTTVQAFLVARKILVAHLDKATSAQPEESLLDATSVILLMDPEHITAANVRKRLIQAHLSDASELGRRIGSELAVIDSLLTSRLHRHTKSPTLWSHRRWLLQLFPKLKLSVNVAADLVNIVMVSGERHPRNYYSWLHARFLVTLPSTTAAEIESTILPSVRDWCFRHFTDISGWSFLHFLLELNSVSNGAAASSVFTETLRLATSLRLTNESMWDFLRTVAASNLVDDAEYHAFLKAGNTLSETAQNPTQAKMLEAALAWSKARRGQDGKLGRHG